jgi:hypothetical protein
LMACVFPGVADVLANPFLLVIMLMREDLPTFDRPMNANSGRVGFGHFDNSTEDLMNSACLTSMV